MLALLMAALVLTDAGASQQVAVIAGPATPGTARRDVEAAPTRRVCRYERATGSNLQQRVCRDVSLGPAFQDEQTREFMRSNQRIRFPDDGAPRTPAGPNG